MKKKGDKKEYTKEEFSRHLGAMAESYHSDVKVMKEGIGGIGKILERIENRLDSHEDRIAHLMVDMSEVKSDVKELRADTIEIKRDTKEVKFDVRTGMDRKVDKKLFVDLDGRVRKLESKR